MTGHECWVWWWEHIRTSMADKTLSTPRSSNGPFITGLRLGWGLRTGGQLGLYPTHTHTKQHLLGITQGLIFPVLPSAGMETQKRAYWEAAVRFDSGDLGDMGKEKQQLCKDDQNCNVPVWSAETEGPYWLEDLLRAWTLLVLLWKDGDLKPL